MKKIDLVEEALKEVDEITRFADSLYDPDLLCRALEHLRKAIGLLREEVLLTQAPIPINNSKDGPRFAEELIAVVLNLPNDPSREFTLNRWALARLANATVEQRAEAFRRAISGK